MTQGDGAVDADADHPLDVAISGFESLRTLMLHQHGSPNRFPQVLATDMSSFEERMRDGVNVLYGELPEIEQLKLYRFYLTAVHRDSVLSRRYDPRPQASSERSAALEKEFHRINEEMDEMIAAFIPHVRVEHADDRQLLARDFCWSVVWWMYARPDVVTFVFRPEDDAALLMLLGRRPSTHQRLNGLKPGSLAACWLLVEHTRSVF